VGVSPNTERTLSKPFVGASTGSALIGAYGIGLEVLDLTSNDKVTELITANPVTPPNYVTNTVAGLIHNEDRVLVGPWDGTSVDSNGDPAITKTQLSLGATYTSANQAVILCVEDIPSDTPASGVIRVTDDDGYERWLPYSSWASKTFTLNTGHTDMGSNNDFDGITGSGTYQATSGNDVYIAYIDTIAVGSTVNVTAGVNGTVYVIKVAGDTVWTNFGAANSNPGTIFTFSGAPGVGTGTMYTYAASASFTSVQSGSRNLVVIVRDGAGTPIKQFISSWSQTSAAGTITAIRTTDI
jgi:hypothetical protein